jgi:hypothetical protein
MSVMQVKLGSPQACRQRIFVSVMLTVIHHGF